MPGSRDLRAQEGGLMKSLEFEIRSDRKSWYTTRVPGPFYALKALKIALQERGLAP
jgi:hypothetical protein